MTDQLDAETPSRYFVGETDARPWGAWVVIGLGHHHIVKRIRVTPGQRLSLQRHRHRAEHWVVVAGTGTVTIDGETKPIGPNDHAFIPATSVHRIANTGDADLVFIEVQFGETLSEADIERLQDDAGRV